MANSDDQKLTGELEKGLQTNPSSSSASHNSATKEDEIPQTEDKEMESTSDCESGSAGDPTEIPSPSVQALSLLLMSAASKIARNDISSAPKADEADAEDSSSEEESNEDASPSSSPESSHLSGRLARAKTQQVILEEQQQNLRTEVIRLLKEGNNADPLVTKQKLFNFQQMMHQVQLLMKLVNADLEETSKAASDALAKPLSLRPPPPLKSKKHVPRPPTSISCPLCSFKATWNEDLVRHIKSCHTNSPSATASPPSKSSSPLSSTRIAPTSSSDKPKALPPPGKRMMRCMFCSYETFRSYHMRRHIRRKHKKEDPTGYITLPENSPDVSEIGDVTAEPMEEKEEPNSANRLPEPMEDASESREGKFIHKCLLLIVYFLMYYF